MEAKMSRVTTMVYDDAVEVPASIFELIGVDCFGNLLYRRQRLWELVAQAAEQAGFIQRLHLRDHADRLALADEAAQNPGVRYVYVSSDVVCASLDTLSRFFEKLAYAETDLVARPPGAPVTSVVSSFEADTLRTLLRCRTQAQRREWFQDRSDVFAPLLVDDDLVSLSLPDRLVPFLAGTFYTRAFNHIDASGRIVVKRSADREKMKREHDFWYLLPHRLQRFVVQPYDFEDAGDTAAYKMERLAVPDAGILWVHGADALPLSTFEALLDRVFDWFAERPSRVDPGAAQGAATALYVTKVEARVTQFLATPTGLDLDALLSAGTVPGGLAALVARYRALLEAEWAQAPSQEVAVLHGDLCLSNILFDKRSRLLRFIDPRGASTEDELWGDAYYDVAKLSHSVLGGYDFINSELFEIVVDEALTLQVRFERSALGEHEAAFVDRIAAQGFDPVRVRLYEASLFLSMLPLHAEAPRKLVAFALTAASILEEVSAARSTREGGVQRWFGRR
jgi:hypothetical protein